MNHDIKAEIKLCENDIKWLLKRIAILKQLAKQKNPTAMQKATALIKELQ
ncbi:MAG TPA: hypothetical protein PLB54_06680 [Nitrosomonas sp.]|nr:hypothetical protein [Nitrosomonas sp.]